MKREKLLQAIEKVKPAVTQTSLTEQSNLILFDTRTVKSYNDEILIVNPIRTKIKGAVPANELISLLQKMKDDKIEVEQKKNEVEIKGETTKAVIKTSDTSFPEITTPKKWKNLQEDFIEGMKYCKFSVAEQGNVLSNVLLTKDRIISCDNYRITEFIMKKETFIKKKHLIPSSAISALISHKPIFFSSDKSWLFFRNEEGASLCIRKTNEKYPDIESILSEKIKGTKIKLPDELREGLQRTKILSDEDIVTGNRIVNINIRKNRLTCHGECAIGRIDETMKIDYKGKDISFAIVPDFLNEILGRTQNMTVGDSSLKFKIKNLVHIIQLIV